MEQNLEKDMTQEKIVSSLKPRQQQKKVENERMNKITSRNFGEEIHVVNRLIHPNLMTRRKNNTVVMESVVTFLISKR